MNLDEACSFENQQHAKYSKCLTTTLRFVGDNTNKGVEGVEIHKVVCLYTAPLPGKQTNKTLSLFIGCL
jgi:hypothetical protein